MADESQNSLIIDLFILFSWQRWTCSTKVQLKEIFHQPSCKIPSGRASAMNPRPVQIHKYQASEAGEFLWTKRRIMEAHSFTCVPLQHLAHQTWILQRKSDSMVQLITFAFQRNLVYATANIFSWLDRIPQRVLTSNGIGREKMLLQKVFHRSLPTRKYRHNDQVMASRFICSLVIWFGCP